MNERPLGPDDLRALDEALAPAPEQIEAWIARADARKPPRRRTAAILLALAASCALWWGLRARDAEAPLQAADRWQPLSDGIDLVVEGTGTRRSGEQLRWEEGTLRVSVRPDAGLRLSIDTPEARIRVVGTLFEVERTRFGTRVQVARGRVEVACTSGPLHQIDADQIAICAADPASALALAVSAGSRGPEEVLAAVASGLELPDRTALLDGELRAQRVEALLALGRLDEASTEAPRLDPAHPTQRDALRRLAVSAPSCEAAAPALSRLAPTDAGAALRLAGCEPDPARAQAILEAVLPHTSGEERAAVEAWLDTLR